MQSARTITIEYVIFFSYVHLKIPLNFLSSSFLTKSCPLYKFETNQNIFIKLHTTIKHQKMAC